MSAEKDVPEFRPVPLNLNSIAFDGRIDSDAQRRPDAQPTAVTPSRGRAALLHLTRTTRSQPGRDALRRLALAESPSRDALLRDPARLRVTQPCVPKPERNTEGEGHAMVVPSQTPAWPDP